MEEGATCLAGDEEVLPPHDALRKQLLERITHFTLIPIIPRAVDAPDSRLHGCLDRLADVVWVDLCGMAVNRTSCFIIILKQAMKSLTFHMPIPRRGIESPVFKGTLLLLAGILDSLAPLAPSAEVALDAGAATPALIKALTLSRLMYVYVIRLKHKVTHEKHNVGRASLLQLPRKHHETHAAVPIRKILGYLSGDNNYVSIELT
jgi:hypothetical protein